MKESGKNMSKEKMMSREKTINGIPLNKFNLEIVLKAIVWYGSGCHGRNTSIPFKVVKEIFEINDATTLQKLYNMLDLNSEDLGVYSVCFADNTIEMENMDEAPVALLNASRSLAIRAIVYSTKDDLDDVAIFVSDFMNDLLM